MAPSYKLSYFDGRGLAETVRYLFKYGGIEFEDVRVNKEDWPQIKETITWEQLPILEFNGKQIGQSVAIARYVANLVKLAGDNAEENLEIDEVIDVLTDARFKIRTVYYEQDEAVKSARIQEILKDAFPFYMSRLDAQVKRNNGYLALGRLTWADFQLVNITLMFDFLTNGDALANYPNLSALRDRVNALPAIKAWLEVRPETEF